MRMPGAVRLDAGAGPRERHAMTCLLAALTAAIALIAISRFPQEPQDLPAIAGANHVGGSPCALQ